MYFLRYGQFAWMANSGCVRPITLYRGTKISSVKLVCLESDQDRLMKREKCIQKMQLLGTFNYILVKQMSDLTMPMAMQKTNILKPALELVGVISINGLCCAFELN